MAIIFANESSNILNISHREIVCNPHYFKIRGPDNFRQPPVRFVYVFIIVCKRSFRIMDMKVTSHPLGSSNIHIDCLCYPSSVLKAATKASCGTETEPMDFMRFLPSFCFSSSFFLREMSPP